MSQNSNIEWTDATWNPVLGCDKISPGCKNCYAIRTAWRLQHNPNHKVKAAFEGLTVLQGGQPNWTGRINFVAERLDEPFQWRQSRRIFVNSQSDLFHEGLSDEQIDLIFGITAITPQHTYQVLTKRPERMREWVTREGGHPLSNTGNHLLTFLDHLEKAGVKLPNFDLGEMLSSWGWPLPNVWLGTSVESPKYKDRIDRLRETPAAVRFLSLEPLLEDLGTIDLTGIHWCIVGGESGPGARPMHPEWARSIRDQCKTASVPFFFKQWGEWAASGERDYLAPQQIKFLRADGSVHSGKVTKDTPGTEYELMMRVGKKAAGRKLDGVEHSEYPNP